MQRLFKKVFDIMQDDDFAMYESVSPTIIQAYNGGEGDGPNPDNLQLDMASGPESQWNKAALGILLEKFKDTRTEEQWSLPDRSDKYLADLIQERFRHVALIWQKIPTSKNKFGGIGNMGSS